MMVKRLGDGPRLKRELFARGADGATVRELASLLKWPVSRVRRVLRQENMPRKRTIYRWKEGCRYYATWEQAFRL